MKITIAIAAYMFLLSFYPAAGNGLMEERCPFYEEVVSPLKCREIETYAKDADERKRHDVAKSLFIRVSQGEQDAPNLLVKLANSMWLNETSTAYLCLKLMVKYNPKWANDNLEKFLIRRTEVEGTSVTNGQKKRLLSLKKLSFNKKPKVSSPALPSQAIGIGTQYLINTKVGINLNTVEFFVRDFLKSLCESQKESDHHVVAQVITEHCYWELDVQHHRQENQRNDAIHWPSHYLVELFKSGIPHKQDICYAVLAKTANELDYLAQQQRITPKDLLELLLSTKEDISFAALLATTYVINKHESNFSYRNSKFSWSPFFKAKAKNGGYFSVREHDNDVNEFSKSFGEQIKRLIPQIESIKERYQEFPLLPLPHEIYTSR